MQIDNVLGSVLVAVILGDDQVVEQHSQAHIESFESAGRIVMRKALGSKAHLHPTSRLPLAAFLEDARSLYERGVRIVFVTGYPKTAADARDIASVCPNLIVFSIEDRGSQYGPDDPRRILGRSKFFPVDAERNGGARQRFMENCINEYLVGLRVSFAAADLDRTRKLATATA